MNAKQICPDCGAELSDDSPAGFCPKCLLKDGLASPTEEQTLAPDTAQRGNPTGGEEDKTTAGRPEAPQIGSKVHYFGDYELLEEIARGGMGVVYKARQVRLNRIVALKMILAGQFASDADVQRFYTEAEAAGQLDHPGVVPVFEVGEYGGHHFFSMSFIEGQSLATRISQDAVPAREAAQLVHQVAEAIQFAHEKGVLHRDLKPANILIDTDGQPRVTDFGLAKRVQGDSQLTATGQILGTPGYMSPEQASGRGDQITESADVYSLGAVLYASLTGRAPFVADNPIDTLMQVLEREPISPRQLNPKAPKDLVTICLKCLRKDRRHRYQSMNELADDLARFLDNQPILARPARAPERAWKWCRRRPAVAMLILVSCAALIGAGIGAAWHLETVTSERNRANEGWKTAQDQRALAEQQQKLAEQQRKIAQQQRQLAEERELRARRYWYIADLQLSRQAWNANDPGRVMELLQNHLPIDDQQDLRGFEWNYLHQLCNNAEALHRDHGSEVFSVRYSTDGNLIASTGTFDKTIRLRDGETGTTHSVLEGHSSVVYDAVFDQQGQRLISCSKDKTIRIWNLDKKEVVTTLKTEIMPLRLALSSDETMIAAAGAGGIEVWNVESGERSFIIKKYFLGSVAFQPGASVLAYGDVVRLDEGVTSCVVLHDASSNQRKATLSGHEKVPTCIEFSRDGKTLVSGSADHTARIWDVQRQETITTLTGHQHAVSAVAISRDGTRVVTASHDKTIRIWDAKTGRQIRLLKGHSDLIHTLDLSPSGKTAVSGGKDKTVRIWNLDTQQAGVRIQSGDQKALRQVAFLSNGSLVTGSAGGSVVVWNTGSGKKVQRIGAVRGITMSLATTGRRVAAAGLGNSSIQLWSGESGDQSTIDVSGRGLRFTIAPDGKRAATGDLNGQISIVDLATGQQETVGRQQGPVYALAWHPNGQRLATAGFGKSIHIWDTSTRSLLTTLEGHKLAVVTLAFNSDGSLLASGSANAIEMDQRREPPTPGKIRLWDMANEPSSRILAGHTGGVLALAFSPDDRTIASASHDQTVRLWDPVTVSETMRFDGDFGRFWSVAFSPDGSQLAAGGDGGTAQVWKITARP